MGINQLLELDQIQELDQGQQPTKGAQLLPAGVVGRGEALILLDLALGFENPLQSIVSAVEENCCLTIWVTSRVIGLLPQSPYNTGSPDGFLLFLER
jgi:hypothetical protein